MVGIYYVIDDYVAELGGLGFEIMCGDPYEAVGIPCASFNTLRECRQYLARRLDPNEKAYRVFLARRHGEHRVKEMLI